MDTSHLKSKKKLNKIINNLLSISIAILVFLNAVSKPFWKETINTMVCNDYQKNTRLAGQLLYIATSDIFMEYYYCK
jgi:hypothetical protein